MCPICDLPLYIEASTGDPVCMACCNIKRGDHYTLLSLVAPSPESRESGDT